MRAAPALLLLVSAAALACSRAERPNVLFIVSDTLRADALSCYGGPAHTPNLCRLAERGTLFERAYSAAPWTLPSSVALFTGNHASGFSDRALGEDGSYHVPAAEALLGEALAARGYTLRFDTENRVVLRPNVFQAFEALPEPRHAGRGEDERAVRMERAVEFLAGAAEPFFLVRWGLDPHAPYAPPPERLAALAPLAEGLPHPLAFYAELGQRHAKHRLAEHAPSFSAAELRLLRALYHAEIEWMDELVGALLAALAERGALERTFVVFAADHGEAFGEHGLFLHGHALIEALIRVPLLVAGPGVAAGRRVSQPVSLTDLVPTLRELLGEAPDPAQQGVSFAALLRAGGESDGRVVYAGSPKESGHGVDALIAGSSKLVARADGSFALFDLAADPGESRDLAAERPAEVAALRERITAIRAANEAQRTRRLAARSPAERDADRRDTERELRALGYVE